MKILNLECHWYSNKSIQQIKDIGELIPCGYEIDQNGLYSLLRNEQFDIIFTRLGLYFSQEVLELQKERLRFLVSPTTGLNHIDLATAEKYGVEVVSLKGEDKFLASVQSTAEHTWALILTIARNLVPAFRSTGEGNWDREAFPADELNTKSIGIIGFGRLGKILLRYAEAFQMKVYLYDINKTVFDNRSMFYLVSLEELLRNSDYVVLLADYRVENNKMFNEDLFQLMRPSAYFINTARGEMVDEGSLLKALKNGWIKGAALDVLDGDSHWNQVPDNHLLIDYANNNKNLLITPHMGGFGKISIEKTRNFIVEKLLKKLNGHNTNC